MKTKRNIFIAFVLNLTFSIVELFGGFITGSIAITSDAIHDFGDAIGIGVAYKLEKLSEKMPNKTYTYGYARYSVVGALITTVILLISSVIVVYNAILRLVTPVGIDNEKMLIFAIVGLIINLIATYFTHGGKSINQKAVNLHMIEDVFGWLIVLIGAIIIRYTNLYIIDPILSIILSLFIVINCIKNLNQIMKIILIKTPKDINIDKIVDKMKHIDGIIDVHHVHVWTIDGQINCATLHIVIKGYDVKIKTKVKELLRENKIEHVTIEFEEELEECGEKSCNIKQNPSCCHHCHNHNN